MAVSPVAVLVLQMVSCDVMILALQLVVTAMRVIPATPQWAGRSHNARLTIRVFRRFHLFTNNPWVVPVDMSISMRWDGAVSGVLSIHPPRQLDV